jgi:hypothetical protein
VSHVEKTQIVAAARDYAEPMPSQKPRANPRKQDSRRARAGSTQRADEFSYLLHRAAGVRAYMKPGAILVNTGGGALVDRDTLLSALTTGNLAGAGLDVFHDEPLKADDPLLKCANTVISPHNAGQTPGVRRDGLLRAIENVENFLAGKPTNIVKA